MTWSWVTEQQVKLVVLDFFSGSKSLQDPVEEAMASVPGKTAYVSLDSDPELDADLPMDVHAWRSSEHTVRMMQKYPNAVWIFWASPDCSAYSRAHTTGVRNLDCADATVQKTLSIVDDFMERGAVVAQFWIENPASDPTHALRLRPFMQDYLRPGRDRVFDLYLVDYCMYGSPTPKPENIFALLPMDGFQPRRCSKSAPCNALQPNGTHMGDSRRLSPFEKARVPEPLLLDLLAASKPALFRALHAMNSRGSLSPGSERSLRRGGPPAPVGLRSYRREGPLAIDTASGSEAGDPEHVESPLHVTDDLPIDIATSESDASTETAPHVGADWHLAKHKDLRASGRDARIVVVPDGNPSECTLTEAHVRVFCEGLYWHSDGSALPQCETFCRVENRTKKREYVLVIGDGSEEAFARERASFPVEYAVARTRWSSLPRSAGAGVAATMASTLARASTRVSERQTEYLRTWRLAVPVAVPSLKGGVRKRTHECRPCEKLLRDKAMAVRHMRSPEHLQKVPQDRRWLE